MLRKQVTKLGASINEQVLVGVLNNKRKKIISSSQDIIPTGFEFLFVFLSTNIPSLRDSEL
jgi:hypothetical protein